MEEKEKKKRKGKEKKAQEDKEEKERIAKREGWVTRVVGCLLEGCFLIIIIFYFVK